MKNNIIKNLAVAIASAIITFVSVFVAGCRLGVGEMSVKDFATDLFTTNSVPAWIK